MVAGDRFLLSSSFRTPHRPLAHHYKVYIQSTYARDTLGHPSHSHCHSRSHPRSLFSLSRTRAATVALGSAAILTPASPEERALRPYSDRLNTATVIIRLRFERSCHEVTTSRHARGSRCHSGSPRSRHNLLHRLHEGARGAIGLRRDSRPCGDLLIALRDDGRLDVDTPACWRPRFGR